MTADRAASQGGRTEAAREGLALTKQAVAAQRPVPSSRDQHIAEGVFFTTPPALPRGRHGMAREEIVAAHRERAMIAATELMALDGYRGVGVREISARAAISRAAFYACFTDKDACVYAAYDRFIGVLIQRLTGSPATGEGWGALVTGIIAAYLDTLQQDLVVARAFQVEMDALGHEARHRRRQALTGLATLLRDRHREHSPAAPGLPLNAYVGLVYAVRQLACDALDEHDHPDLRALIPETAPWITELISPPARG